MKYLESIFIRLENIQNRLAVSFTQLASLRSGSLPDTIRDGFMNFELPWGHNWATPNAYATQFTLERIRRSFFRRSEICFSSEVSVGIWLMTIRITPASVFSNKCSFLTHEGNNEGLFDHFIPVLWSSSKRSLFSPYWRKPTFSAHQVNLDERALCIPFLDTILKQSVNTKRDLLRD